MEEFVSEGVFYILQTPKKIKRRIAKPEMPDAKTKRAREVVGWQVCVPRSLSAFLVWFSFFRQNPTLRHHSAAEPASVVQRSWRVT